MLVYSHKLSPATYPVLRQALAGFISLNLQVIIMTTKTLFQPINAYFLVLLFMLSFVAPANARQLDGVSLPDSVTIDGTSVPLQLNGMGYRTKFIFKIRVDHICALPSCIQKN